MVTQEFLSNFEVTSIDLSQVEFVNNLYTITAPNNGQVGQIVKAEFTDCLPGIKLLYSNNLDPMIINLGENLIIEEPTDKIEVYGKSLLFENEPLRGTVYIYYWYPDTIENFESAYMFVTYLPEQEIVVTVDKDIQYINFELNDIETETDGNIVIHFANNTTETILLGDGYYSLGYDSLYNDEQQVLIEKIVLGSNVKATSLELGIKGGTTNDSVVVLE